MNKSEKVLALREGGRTTRVHTFQYVGPYNVAIHCYNAVNLLFVLHPKEPSVELVKAIMWHDTPERWTGDVPAPAKWASLPLKEALDCLEEHIMDKLEIKTELMPNEEKWLKAVDMVELWLWAIEQTKYGNTTAKSIQDKILGAIENSYDWLPKEVIDFVDNFKWKQIGEVEDL